MTERRGVALIVALIVLLIIALLGASVMMLYINEDRFIDDKIKRTRLYTYVESGISEAVRRLSLEPDDSLYIGDRSDPLDAGWTVYILNSDSLPGDSPPVFFKSSVQMLLPESLRIPYTTKVFDKDYSLVVHHKRKDDDNNKIIYYNWRDKTEESHEPSTYEGIFSPVEVIEVTGKAEDLEKRVMVEVVRKGVDVDIKAAFSCDSDVEIRGKLTCCGHNHNLQTPWGTDAGENRYECFDNGEDGDDALWHILREDGQSHGAKETEYRKDSKDPKCSEVGCIPGISAPGHSIKINENSSIRGNPDFTNDGAVATFNNIYKIFGISGPDELEDSLLWRSIEGGTINGGSFTGLYKCEEDLSLSGVININGVLWVTSNLRQDGHLFVKGLIYSESDIQFNGKFWILGAVVTEGNARRVIHPFDGTGVLLYSKGAIERAIASGNGCHRYSK
jgi:hypothetical protein